MAKICSKCKKNIIEGNKDIFFIYEGLKVGFIRFPFWCNKCEKEEFIKSFNDLKEYNLIFREIDNIKVDWEVYIKYYNGNIVDKMSAILRSLTIFSLQRKGNWEIVTHSRVSLNPYHKNHMLYFTREEDVQEYSRLSWFYPRYGWEIRQIIVE